MIRANPPRRSGGYGRGVLRLLRRPRWIAFTLLTALLCVAFVELGQWQLRRHDERAAFNDSVREGQQARPVWVGQVLTAGHQPSVRQEWQSVRVSGRYDGEWTLLVRNRPLEGRVGFWVVTPLVTGTGTAVLVNRGWVPAGATARSVPDVPPVPDGTVTVTGRLRLSETDDDPAFRAPEGQVLAVDVERIADRLPYSLYGGYVELVGQRPPPRGGLERLPPPVLSAGPHLSYAVQWFLFVGVALVGWWVLLRNQAREDSGARGSPPPGSPAEPSSNGADPVRTAPPDRRSAQDSTPTTR